MLQTSFHFDLVGLICFMVTVILSRVYSLGSLKRGEKDILVATDVAGRGIDIRYVLMTWIGAAIVVITGMFLMLSTMTWLRQLMTTLIVSDEQDVLEKLELQ